MKRLAAVLSISTAAALGGCAADEPETPVFTASDLASPATVTISNLGDLRDEFIAAGGSCDEYVEDDALELAAQSATCEKDTTLAYFSDVGDRVKAGVEARTAGYAVLAGDMWIITSDFALLTEVRENGLRGKIYEAMEPAPTAAAVRAIPFTITEQPPTGQDGTIRITVDEVPSVEQARMLLDGLQEVFTTDGGYFVQINCSTGGTPTSDNRLANGKFAIGAIGAARTGLTAGTGTVELVDNPVCPAIAATPEAAPEPAAEDFTAQLLAANTDAPWSDYLTSATLDAPDHATIQTSIIDPRGPDGSPEALLALQICETVVTHLANQGITAGVRILEADESSFVVRGQPGGGLAPECTEY